MSALQVMRTGGVNLISADLLSEYEGIESLWVR